MRRRPAVGKYAMMITGIAAAAMLLLLRVVVLMAAVTVVIQPCAKHVEVALQRLEQLINNIATGHRLVAEWIRMVVVGVVLHGRGGGRRDWSLG